MSASLTPPAAAAASSTAASSRTSRRVQVGCHARAGLEAQLTLGDDDFTGLQALLDDGVLIDPLSRDDRTLLHGGIGLDDKRVLAVLSGLHGLGGDDDRMRHGRKAQCDA